MLINSAFAPGRAQHCHHLGLHICWKPRKWTGMNILNRKKPPAGFQINPLRRSSDLAAHGFTYMKQAADILHRFIHQFNLSSGACCRQKIGSGNDPVRHHPVPGIPQRHFPENTDFFGSRTVNRHSHGLQKSGQIPDLRFPGCIVDPGNTIGHNGGHHQIFRRPHTRIGQKNPCAFQPIGFTVNRPVILLNMYTHLLQGVQMDIHRPCANRTAARII